MTWAATILRTGLKEMETNWPWNERLDLNNQDAAAQTTDDQFKDDGQGWLCYFCM